MLRMIKYLPALVFCIFLSVGCQEDLREADISQVQRGASFKRFDQAFFESDTNRMQEVVDSLALQYPEFFVGGKNLLFWSSQRRDPKQLELYRTAQKVFDDPRALNENLEFSMKHYYYYFPDEPEIEFYAYISNLDFEFPVIFADTVCFAALDLYLGPGKAYYSSLPEYIAFYRQPAFLVRDIMESLISSKVPPRNPDGSLLEDMIYFGKKLYILEHMMPQKEDKIIVQYTPEELAFCRENERSMWSYFIENKHLFDTSQELKRRFIELAPFSKFRMQFDRDTPGMVGRWIGWQIVSAYMENNPNLSIPQLAQETDARKILKLSGYKP